MSIQIAWDHIKRLVHDQKHWTARSLRSLKEKTGIDVETLAGGIVLFLSYYLVAGKHAQFVANFLLTVFPILFCYVFIDERPRENVLDVYWAMFAIDSLFDAICSDFFAGYYLIKVLSLGMMFLEPFNYAEKTADMLTMLGMMQKEFETAVSRSMGPRTARSSGIHEEALD